MLDNAGDIDHIETLSLSETLQFLSEGQSPCAEALHYDDRTISSVYDTRIIFNNVLI